MARIRDAVLDDAEAVRPLPDASEAAARDAGCHRIELTTLHDNEGAHALHRAAGWIETGLRFKKVL